MTKEFVNAFSILEKAKREKKPLIVFDVETEGFDPKKHHIIQLSGIKMSPFDFSKRQAFNFYINPGRPLTDKIVEITGITDEILANEPLEEVAFPAIEAFFGENPYVLGHVVDFDIRMTKALYERQGKTFTYAGSIDTCQMARELLRKDIKSHKLCDVAEYYGFAEGVEFHNANADVQATADIFECMLLDVTKSKTPLIQPAIYSIGFFEGFRGHQRVYIQTSIGSIYYDSRDKIYGSKEVNIEEVDMDFVEKKALAMKKVGDITELLKNVREEHYAYMAKKVGISKMCNTMEEAKKLANAFVKKHYDVSIMEKEGLFEMKILSFNKSKKGNLIA